MQASLRSQRQALGTIGCSDHGTQVCARCASRDIHQSLRSTSEGQRQGGSYIYIRDPVRECRAVASICRDPFCWKYHTHKKLRQSFDVVYYSPFQEPRRIPVFPGFLIDARLGNCRSNCPAGWTLSRQEPSRSWPHMTQTGITSEQVGWPAGSAVVTDELCS